MNTLFSSCTPQGWLEGRLRARAALFPRVDWGLPPLALSRGLVLPAMPAASSATVSADFPASSPTERPNALSATLPTVPPDTLPVAPSIPLPEGPFLLGDVKVPERNIEWPAALLFRAALRCAPCGYGRTCGRFLAAGGLEAFVLAQGLTVMRRVTVARGAGLLMLCRR